MKRNVSFFRKQGLGEVDICFLRALGDYLQEKTREHRDILMAKAIGIRYGDPDRLLERLDIDDREEWAKILVFALNSGVPPLLYDRLLLLSPLRRMKPKEIRSFFSESE